MVDVERGWVVFLVAGSPTAVIPVLTRGLAVTR
ncbi:hypothetical protein ACVW00_002421 [Marmoricola sp. URHA0025 HA25]